MLLAVFHPLMSGDQLRAPEFGEILKVGIRGPDEIKLFLTPPALLLFLASDGAADILVAFKVEAGVQL